MGLFSKKVTAERVAPAEVDPLDKGRIIANNAISAFTTVVAQLETSNDHLEQARAQSHDAIADHQAQIAAEQQRVTLATDTIARNVTIAKKVSSIVAG